MFSNIKWIWEGVSALLNLLTKTTTSCDAPFQLTQQPISFVQVAKIWRRRDRQIFCLQPLVFQTTYLSYFHSNHNRYEIVAVDQTEGNTPIELTRIRIVHYLFVSNTTNSVFKLKKTHTVHSRRKTELSSQQIPWYSQGKTVFWLLKSENLGGGSRWNCIYAAPWIVWPSFVWPMDLRLPQKHFFTQWCDNNDSWMYFFPHSLPRTTHHIRTKEYEAGINLSCNHVRSPTLVQDIRYFICFGRLQFWIKTINAIPDFRSPTNSSELLWFLCL